jgi:hypothetical protein
MLGGCGRAAPARNPLRKENEVGILKNIHGRPE